MRGFLAGPVRPFSMPPARGERRDSSWRSARRPTVADRERSDEIVLDGLLAVTGLALCFGVPNLAALLRMAGIA